MEDPIKVCRDCNTLVHIEEVVQFIRDSDQVICPDCTVVKPVEDAVKKRIAIWASKK